VNEAVTVAGLTYLQNELQTQNPPTFLPSLLLIFFLSSDICPLTSVLWHLSSVLCLLSSVF